MSRQLITNPQPEWPANDGAEFDHRQIVTAVQAVIDDNPHADTCWLELSPQNPEAYCSCWQADLAAVINPKEPHDD